VKALSQRKYIRYNSKRKAFCKTHNGYGQFCNGKHSSVVAYRLCDDWCGWSGLKRSTTYQVQGPLKTVCGCTVLKAKVHKFLSERCEETFTVSEIIWFAAVKMVLHCLCTLVSLFVLFCHLPLSQSWTWVRAIHGSVGLGRVGSGQVQIFTSVSGSGRVQFCGSVWVTWIIQNVTLNTRSSAIAVIADRTACSILTLFIAIATSRPLNKKIRSLSVRGSNNYCGSASAIRSPHTAPSRQADAYRHGRLMPAVTVPCVIVDKRAVSSTRMPRVAWIHMTLMAFLTVLWCILWLNDTS